MNTIRLSPARSFAAIGRVLQIGAGLLCLLSASADLRADTVHLGNGNRVENVRVLFQGGKVNLIFENGSIQIYDEEQILRIETVPVSWVSVDQQAEFEERARERIAEAQREQRAKERDRREKEGALRRESLFMSLAFPGVGQIRNGRPERGFVFTGIAAVLTVRAIDLYERRRSAIRDYRDRSAAFGLPFLLGQFGPEVNVLAGYAYFGDRIAKIEENTSRFNTVTILLAILWTVSALDAYFNADVSELSGKSQINLPGLPKASEFPRIRRPNLPKFGPRAQDLRFSWSFAL